MWSRTLSRLIRILGLEEFAYYRRRNKASKSEWELTESMANDIRASIHKHYVEKVVLGCSNYEKVEVLIPMTEKINMTFEIDVPYKMMDEGNDELLEYFKEQIYPIINKE